MDGFQLGLCPTYWRSVYCRRQQREHSSMDSTWKPKPSAHTYKHWISEVECRTRTQQILVALLLLGRAVCVENITLEEEPPKTRRNVAYHPPSHKVVACHVMQWVVVLYVPQPINIYCCRTVLQHGGDSVCARTYVTRTLRGSVVFHEWTTLAVHALALYAIASFIRSRRRLVGASAKCVDGFWLRLIRESWDQTVCLDSACVACFGAAILLND